MKHAKQDLESTIIEVYLKQRPDAYAKSLINVWLDEFSPNSNK